MNEGSLNNFSYINDNIFLKDVILNEKNIMITRYVNEIMISLACN